MISVNVNGEDRQIDGPDDMPLLWALRDVLGMTGTKFGCGIAQCGACTVHVDGMPVRSCVLPLSAVGAREVTTIEAIGETANGKSMIAVRMVLPGKRNRAIAQAAATPKTMLQQTAIGATVSVRRPAAPPAR